MRLQQFNRLIDDKIDVQQGVVIGIYQLLLRTILNLIGVAGRRKAAELRRIAIVIGRAVAADGMQHDNAITLQLLNIGLKPVKKHLVVAFALNTHSRQIQAGNILMRHAIAGAFATAVVIVP